MKCFCKTEVIIPDDIETLRIFGNNRTLEFNEEKIIPE
jgi:hypothetical protein